MTSVDGQTARILERLPEARLLGSDPIFLEALALAQRLARSDLAVALIGETGTGKELFARTVHENSARADGPFIAINCGAVSPALLESELFGHVEGAFTGACRSHPGVFEQADGGTLFLDEIGEMPLAMQASVLRALENGEVRAVGDARARKVDVRIISATNRELDQMIAEGTFRRDLAYRIAGATIRIPPLRRRGDDVIELARAFLAKEVRSARRRVLGFSPEAIEALLAYPFPGNIRELRNEIARAVALTEDDEEVKPSAFSERIAPRSASTSDRASCARTLKEIVERAERQAIEIALNRARGNVSRAAKELGVTRPGLYKLMLRLGLRSPKIT